MHPVQQPYETGMLATGDGHEVYWEQCGNPDGTALLVVHGGPGSGASPWWTQFCDPARYRVVLVDQRGSGRSQPHAGDTTAALVDNTTAHLIADFEHLRSQLGIDSWVLFGGSWGSTLALAYAVEHPERVRALALWAVVTTRRHEVDWLTHTMGHVYPAEFDALLAALPAGADSANVPLAVHRLLVSPDPAVADAGARAWCAWEDRLATLAGAVQPSPRYEDARFRLGFSRIVTHYFGHHAFLADDAITGRLHRIAHIPAVLVRGRLDIASPLRVAHELAQALPLAELHVVEDAVHAPGGEGEQVLVDALDRFAR
ncbi:prolyl aminopeptidase [Humibacillus xanthopallidus]|uniref:Proline iminopeptidase n=1 Tax=Humibacillus xanthopallidus TaxID=412689 RepID=A0A543I251_9MICO|nr:prolyl aminopeptidase [Humibacillus xanthopallidus]TQM64688.1 proline iminopeptidase [Humibacillus xanthopallidus]